MANARFFKGASGEEELRWEFSMFCGVSLFVFESYLVAPPEGGAASHVAVEAVGLMEQDIQGEQGSMRKSYESLVLADPVRRGDVGHQLFL